MNGRVLDEPLVCHGVLPPERLRASTSSLGGRGSRRRRARVGPDRHRRFRVCEPASGRENLMASAIAPMDSPRQPGARCSLKWVVRAPQQQLHLARSNAGRRQCPRTATALCLTHAGVRQPFQGEVAAPAARRERARSMQTGRRTPGASPRLSPGGSQSKATGHTAHEGPAECCLCAAGPNVRRRPSGCLDTFVNQAMETSPAHRIL